MIKIYESNLEQNQPLPIIHEELGEIHYFFNNKSHTLSQDEIKIIVVALDVAAHESQVDEKDAYELARKLEKIIIKGENK